MTRSTPADAARRALLPAGLQDVLASAAAQEAEVVRGLVATCGAFGYERVEPPLLEFEDSLFAGPGAQVADSTFRLMDPLSQRMMGLRADITPQVARIAATRLGRAPRPLRLCYAGPVLRVRGSQLRPERQVTQVGAELIGVDAEAADVEAVVVAAEALRAVGVARLSVDLSVPPLVGALCDALALPASLVAELRLALDRKDAAAVADLAADHAGLFLTLMRAAGPAEAGIAALRRLDLPPAAAALTGRLERVHAAIAESVPDLPLTVDPVEHRGFEYQTGLSFTFFARGVRGELGRGGRYETPGLSGESEPATGFSLYMDVVLRALPPATSPRKLYLPPGTAPAEAARLRGAGWATVSGFSSGAGPVAEARRLGCSHRLQQETIVPVEDETP